MAIEVFTKQQFEAALPTDKDNGRPWWSEVEVTTEYAYYVPVSEEVGILIMSSIRRGETHCGDTGENSIRAWLVDSIEYQPLGVKLQRWTARTRNWRDNMLTLLRELWKVGLLLGDCKKCGTARKLLKTKKDGPNKDRLFVACQTKNCSFVWVDEEVTG